MQKSINLNITKPIGAEVNIHEPAETLKIIPQLLMRLQVSMKIVLNVT